MIYPFKRLAPLKRTLSRYHTPFGMSTGKMSAAEREAKAASSPQISPQIHSCKQKRKSCPSCQSCLKLLLPPTSPRERKPKAHPCAKGDTPRASPVTTPCTANPNAHTTHATFHTTSLAPASGKPGTRLRPAQGNRRQSSATGAAACKTKKRPFPVLPRPGPGRIPPEAASPPTRLRLPAFPAPPLHPALACFPLPPRRTRHPPASSARQGQGGKPGHTRRVRRASAPGAPVAPAFPGSSAGFAVCPPQASRRADLKITP